MPLVMSNNSVEKNANIMITVKHRAALLFSMGQKFGIFCKMPARRVISQGIESKFLSLVSMYVHLISAKFHPDPIRSKESRTFFDNTSHTME